MQQSALTDEELRLRPIAADDADAIFDSCHGGDMARFIPGFPDPYERDDAAAFAARAVERWRAAEAYAFAIVAGGSDHLVGVIELRAPEDGAADVGYWVRDDARGRGIATRALRLVSEWAIRELGVERLWLTAAPDNVASQRVAEKVGFQREGVLRAHLRFRDGRRDSVMFSLLPADLR